MSRVLLTAFLATQGLTAADLQHVVTGRAGFALGGGLVFLTVMFFFLLLLREKHEEVSPAVQAEGKSRRWMEKKAASLQGEGEYKGAGDLYSKLEEYEKAAKMYIQGKALGKAADMFVKMKEFEKAGLACEKRGMWEKAAGFYVDASNAEKAASAYKNAGMPMEAAKAFEKGRMYTQAADVYRELKHFRKAGELYFKAGDYLRAAQALEEGMKQEMKRLPKELAPSESRMLNNLSMMIGGFYAQEGQSEEAAAAYESGGHLAEAAQIHEQAGRYPLAAQYFMKAGEPFKAAIAMEKMGHKEEAAVTRAEAYRERGQNIEAVSHFEFAGKFEEAGKIYEKMGEFSKAARMFERAGKQSDAARMYLKSDELDLAAAALEAAGDYKRAAEIYGQVGNNTKRAKMLLDAGELLESGKIYYEHGQVENAIKALQRIEESDGDFEQAILMLGDIFREKGIPKIALQHYRRVLTGQTPNRSNLHSMYNMALTLEAVGQLRDALQLYEAIIVVDYHHADVADRVRALQQREISMTTPSTPSEGLVSTPSSVDDSLLGDAPPAPGAPLVHRERRYELIEEVGRGGMGIVYKARDTVLDRIVAYKVLPANLREHPQAIKNFFREAKSAAALNHTNIVTVYDAGEEDGNYYIAMEYLRGKTLKQILNREGRLKLDDMLLISSQICRALTYAHGRKIVHRDIKSSNIMLTEDRIVKIMDFGLAKVIEEVKGSQTMASGTPYYMSPEQTLGKNIDHRTDLYSLGVTMFEMATGILPFMDGEAAYHHVHTAPPKPIDTANDIHPVINDIVLKLMAKNPDDRFQSAEDVLDQIRKIMENSPGHYGMDAHDIFTYKPGSKSSAQEDTELESLQANKKRESKKGKSKKGNNG